MDPGQNSPAGSPAAPTGRPEVVSSDEEAAEFARLPRRTGRHPVMLGGAALLATFLIISMRRDIRFALAPADPLNLGDAKSLVAAGPRGEAALRDAENRVVTVSGAPDRESAVELDTKGSWTATQLFRLLGTESRLFVHRLENPLPAAKAEKDVFTGRLVRFADLSFEAAIRAHFSQHVAATHFFEPAALLKVVPSAGQGFSLKDSAGDTVTLGANDLLAFDELRADVVRLGLPRARFPTEADAKAAIKQADPKAEVLSLTSPSPERWSVDVTFAGGQRDKALQLLAERDRHIDMRQARTTHKARVGALKLTPDATGVVLTDGVAPAVTVLASHLASVRTLANVVIPPDAYLVVESEMPRDHLRDLAIAGVLMVFASVNALGLIQALRP